MLLAEFCTSGGYTVPVFCPASAVECYALAVEAFRTTAAYDARIAAELPDRIAAAGVALPDEPGLPGSSDPYPSTLTIGTIPPPFAGNAYSSRVNGFRSY